MKHEWGVLGKAHSSHSCSSHSQSKGIWDLTGLASLVSSIIQFQIKGRGMHLFTNTVKVGHITKL